MSNCVVGSVGLRLPGSIIAEHSVEGSDHFSHDGDDDDLGFLVSVGKTVGEGLESGIVSACAEGCHVEDITDRHPTTVDTSVSPELATVEVVWCETDEGGDLLAAHLPEFWQQGDEREGQHRADAWHRGQQLIELSESSIGGDHLGQALVEEADIGLQSDQAAFAEPPEHGIFEMGGLVLDGDMLVTQLSPHGDDLGEPFDRVVPLHNSCRHYGDILGASSSRCSGRGGLAVRDAGAAASETADLRFLGATSPSAQKKWTDAFVQRLRELGWIDGRTIAIEYRWAEGRTERAAEIFAEFVRLKVDVIVTHPTPLSLAAKQATSLIPIVFEVAGDPVGTGLVTSLSRPGGNVTGLSLQITDTVSKQLELLREVVPASAPVGDDNRISAIPSQYCKNATLRQWPPRSASRSPFWKSGKRRISRLHSRRLKAALKHFMSAPIRL